MKLTTQRIPLVKRRPLTISRGTIAGSENLLVTLEHDGIVGWGEVAPGGLLSDSADSAEAGLAEIAEALSEIAPWERQRVEEIADGRGGATRAALDMACWDWLGKKVNLPVWRLLGLDRSRIVKTSVTVGINPPEIAAEQAREWIARTGARVLKIKLGSPDGIGADRAIFSAVREAAGPGATLRVDANGGWSVEGARSMLAWLAERGCEYAEQPLARGAEADLAALRPSPLPVFVDESVAVAADVPRVASSVDGVNLKLMKTGGLSEALRLIHTTRAHGLRLMIGCMGESALAITAATQIAPLVDFLDLDSHLNLTNDPFIGAVWEEGKVTPTDAPGLGVSRC